MKKETGILLILLLVVVVYGCGNNNEKSEKSGFIIFPIDSVTIEVDYAIPLDSLITLGKYSYVDPTIQTIVNDSIKSTKGKRREVVHLIFPITERPRRKETFENYNLGSRDLTALLQQLEIMGLRGANFRELLTLGAKSPRPGWSVVALGTALRLSTGGLVSNIKCPQIENRQGDGETCWYSNDVSMSFAKFIGESGIRMYKYTIYLAVR
jgi:hypothetical protein